MNGERLKVMENDCIHNCKECPILCAHKDKTCQMCGSKNTVIILARDGRVQIFCRDCKLTIDYQGIKV